MGELNITFSGICVGIHRIVPGVPLRVVLPDALAVRYGKIRIPLDDGHLHDVEYYLMPHVARIRDRMMGGRHMPLNGSYIRLLNARDQPYCIDDAGGYRLSEFDTHVALDSNVVLEGNAQAYFDVLGGRVWTEGEGNDPRTLHVCIRTDGKPRIGITPLPGAVEPLELETEIDTEELYITNLDVEAAVEDTPFDFLLNYLVAKGGIPKELNRRTPGLPAEPAALTMKHLGERLRALGLLIETGGTVEGWTTSIEMGDEPGKPLPLIPPQAVAAERVRFADRLASAVIDPVAFDPSCSYGNLP